MRAENCEERKEYLHEALRELRGGEAREGGGRGREDRCVSDALAYDGDSVGGGCLSAAAAENQG
jgi:hypothetical protein